MNSNKASTLLLKKKTKIDTFHKAIHVFARRSYYVLEILENFHESSENVAFFTQKILAKESLTTTISVQYDRLCTQHVCRVFLVSNTFSQLHITISSKFTLRHKPKYAVRWYSVYATFLKSLLCLCYDHDMSKG